MYYRISSAEVSALITKKQKAAILADYREIIISIINIISKSGNKPEHKMRLVSFLLMAKDVIDLESERLDYAKVMEMMAAMEGANDG